MAEPMAFKDMAGKYAGYFDFLMRLVGGGEWWDDLTANMVRLFERKYYFVREVDENAAYRGKKLRDEFRKAVNEGLTDGFVPDRDEEASVLEVLVALAIQIDDEIMFNKKYGNRANQVFERIIGELGFDMDISGLDSQIDSFLDGDLMLSRVTRRDQTLWEQANVLFGDWFDLENAGYMN